MIQTRFTEVAGVRHPVVLGGMAGGTSPAQVAAVSAAGGLGVQGASGQTPDHVHALAADIRAWADAPFGMNLLLFRSGELADPVLEARPAWLSTAWPAPGQRLGPIFEAAHAAGCLIMHMASTSRRRSTPRPLAPM